MRLFKNLALASFLAIAGTMVIAPMASAGDKVEKKCDKSGKPCEKGDDCKAENCKK